MSEHRTIDERYFEWLYVPLVNHSNTRSNVRYVKLCEQLFLTPFSWSVYNDGNRVEDARELRKNFLSLNQREYRTVNWYEMDASVLEVIVALAARLAYKSDETPGASFWRLINNLGLDDCTDDVWDSAVRARVRRTTKRLIERTYRPNGKGGLFPLSDPQEDQRTVELWSQMNAYLWERMPYR